MIIRNSILPIRGFKCINLFGILFVRKGCDMNSYDMNHEMIHTRQMLEMLVLPFYIWYCVEFLIKLVFVYRNSKSAYRAISFEREAFNNQDNLIYLKKRKHFAWFSLINKVI
nr:MAG TPA: hypothetical protein [Caudoviricetes sp.]